MSALKRITLIGMAMAIAISLTFTSSRASASAPKGGAQAAATSSVARAAIGTPSAVPGVTFGGASHAVVKPMGSSAAIRTAAARGGKPRSLSRPALKTDRVQAQTTGRFWELQLNLCNSGFAACYANGDSVFEGGDLIFFLQPNLVTLNEICSNDIPNYLLPSLGEAWPNDWVYYVFMPAISKSTNAAYKCKNGDDFGNAVMGRVPAGSFQGVNAWGGLYTSQDAKDEQRTFACAYAIGDHLACATHLSSDSEPIALAQCRALMFDVVPFIRATEGTSGKTIVGGDFNLEFDTADPENVQNCVPAGNTRKGDGAVQHVIFSNDLVFNSTENYGLTYTDHDGFMVKLTMP